MGAPASASHGREEAGNGRRMRDEMGEQPAVLARLVSSRNETAELVRAIAPRPLSGVLLLARGSSDNAALHARYLMELTTQKPAGLVAPSLWTRYHASTSLAGWLVVAVSQSGRTPEISTAVTRMSSAGARVLSVTNDEDSALAEGSDGVVGIRAGEEVAVPATKTVTASILALAHIAAALGQVPWAAKEESLLPVHVAEVLDDYESVERALDAVQDRETIHVGRGYTYSVAMESALKLEETTTRGARGYACEDFLHGPIAAAGPQTAAIGYAAAGPTYSDVTAVLSKIRRTGVITVLVTDMPRPPRGAGNCAFLPVPPGLPEPLVAILLMVRAQQFAYLAALRAGLDPDRPEGLNKITTTH
jgi:glucosamine--fructose-6-phosphate aminotransferase (isomerizing)